MSENEHYFVEWKEHFVSLERGNRVVHYFLKNWDGESILAVIGTERSVRHMFYVVADEFLEVHGNESFTNSNFKWRSRREVVDWLTSMLSKQHIHGDLCESLQSDLSQAFRSPVYPSNAACGPQIQVAKDPGYPTDNFKTNSPDIVWSGNSWTCGKLLKHFPGFCRNGIKIVIKSFVFVMAKGENRYVAYMEDMYEDKRGQKKVKVRWFHHNQEVKGVIPLQNSHPKEVFITPYVQVISAECVDGPATVLTCEHYNKCVAVFPQALLAKVHLCYRQFKSKRVKPFDLGKMHGYFEQPILSYLSPNFLPNSEFSSSLIGEEDKLGPSDYVKLGTKRTRNGRPCQRVPTDRNPNLGFLDRRLLSWYTPLFNVDDNIELLCQDSGIQGCWFRCKVLQTSRKQIRVQYRDLIDEEGCGNLEEWIPACRIAKPDKIGMRHLGRPMIRPAPPNEEIELPLRVGAAIDAWWSDGWWEGIITGFGSSDDNFQVYFPGESLLLNMDKKDLRKSRDWWGDKWIEIEAKPEVLTAISLTISSCTNPFVSSNVAKDVENVNSGVNTLSRSDAPSSSGHIKPELGVSSSVDNLPEDMDLVNDDKPTPTKDSGTESADGNDIYGDIQDDIGVIQGNDDGDDKDDHTVDDEGQEGVQVLKSPGRIHINQSK